MRFVAQQLLPMQSVRGSFQLPLWEPPTAEDTDMDVEVVVTPVAATVAPIAPRAAVQDVEMDDEPPRFVGPIRLFPA